jgi:hypothetical protein
MDDLNDGNRFVEIAHALGIAIPTLSGYAIRACPLEKPAEKEE